jgi:hypothetical protein
MSPDLPAALHLHGRMIRRLPNSPIFVPILLYGIFENLPPSSSIAEKTGWTGMGIGIGIASSRRQREGFEIGRLALKDLLACVLALNLMF